MEHVVTADFAGVVDEVTVEVGSTVAAGETLLTIAPDRRFGDDGRRRPSRARSTSRRCAPISPRCSTGTSAPAIDRRPDAVARRHDAGRRTARENVADLRRRGIVRRVRTAGRGRAAQPPSRSRSSSSARRPTALVGGVGTVDGRPVVAMSYDYTVLAGTQGLLGHEKKDRLFEIAERRRLPVVFFTEGGGGRPGDTDGLGVSGPRLPRVLLRSPGSAGWCRSSGSRRGTASRGTRRSSGVATSSSASPARTSRWAVPR